MNQVSNKEFQIDKNWGTKTSSMLVELISNMTSIRNEDNSNYYPDLEIPILSDEVSEYIIGANNLNSPIRQNISEYSKYVCEENKDYITDCNLYIL